MTDFSAIYPELVLVAFAVALPAVHLLFKSSKAMAAISLTGLGASALALLFLLYENSSYILGGANTSLVQLNYFAGLFDAVFIVVAFIVILTSARYVEKDRHIAEYYSLILLSVVGMMIVASSLELITLFVGLELASISSFALVSFRKKDKRGAEGAAKYYIIGALSSAIALYGISLLYGVTGSTSFAGINSYYENGGGMTAVSLLAIVMIVAGFGYKVAIVPFHMWAPDVYEAAPTPVSGLLASGSKKMGLAALFKIFLIAVIALRADWQIMFAVLAVLTMTVGNVMALSQTNIKRMLAYSSIAQAGYILMIIPVSTQYAVAGGLYMILAHAFMKAGAFMIVAALAYVSLGENISDYKGLAKRAPLMAFAMMMMLLSLAGIPPLAGFEGKFLIFSSAIFASSTPSQSWLLWLAVAAIINSALSLYYYVRIVKYMYVDEGPSKEKFKIPKTMTAAVLMCVVGVIVLGIWPDQVLNFCIHAAQGAFPSLPWGGA